MYIPKHFQIDDEDAIYEVIKENGFATLFSQHLGSPCATHIPLTLDKENKYLYGHFARPNEQWQDIEKQEVLAVFHGPHCYISPSWYETGRAVPTWNYVAVHVYGYVEILDGEELMGALRDLVLKYENQKSSYQYDQIDPQFIKGMTRGLVGFKIKIDKIEAKAKLSQNHSVERLERVIQQLEQSQSEDSRKIAHLMKENLRNKS
ncbi:FMN-binding negative transcriptional regulator [Sporolactobacillus laevolacticus]|uniref:FMN-binding negative transcriptional regulator n=1 Tax=Sporolactobacillus laevolacticus TaxID=33018 RepID=UPI0025B4356C|nr:FMN-binding negative transcriptional regulator [Sporolactobacillus laevolacticus]MDN3954968.1 FMN-binding negative transcriptional regulator [Sporolactobacillus laevolacticus]